MASLKSCFILFVLQCALCSSSSRSFLFSHIHLHLHSKFTVPTVAFKCIWIDLREKERKREGEERRERGMGDGCHDNCHNNHPNDWCAALHFSPFGLSLCFSLFSLSVSVSLSVCFRPRSLFFRVSTIITGDTHVDYEQTSRHQHTNVQ